MYFQSLNRFLHRNVYMLMSLFRRKINKKTCICLFSVVVRCCVHLAHIRDSQGHGLPIHRAARLSKWPLSTNYLSRARMRLIALGSPQWSLLLLS